MSDEITEKLDELEAEQETDEQLNLSEEKQEEKLEEADGKEDEKPPGFLSPDEWEAAGKDPADYRGENAYKAQYESLKEIRELKTTMNQVVEGVDSWKHQQTKLMNQQIEQDRIEAVADLEKAKTGDDLPGALAAQDKLNNLKPVNNEVKPNPVVTDFTSKHPMLDKTSSQYDAEFLRDVQMIQGGILDKLLGGDRSMESQQRLTPSQIERSLNLAFNDAKSLHADKFVSPKNKRLVSANPTKKVKTETVNLKSIKNSRNPRDQTPAQDIYDILKAKDPAAAETFAKNIGESNA